MRRPARNPPLGLGRARRGLSCAALVLGLAGAAGAAPGSKIDWLPTGFAAPQDIALDEDDGSYWITSFLASEIFHFGPDLKERLGAIPVPFENLLFPFALGIAFDSRSRTLWVVDSFQGNIHELKKSGEPTGRVIAVPFPGSGREAAGLDFDPGGDDGRGSLYVLEHGQGLILELDLEGALIRQIPPLEDPDRYFGEGAKAHPYALDLIHRDGSLDGILVASPSEGLLRLDLDGRFTGEWMSLDEAGAPASGILLHRLPHPQSGQTVDALITVVGTEGRIALLEPGVASYPEITRFECQVAGADVALSWKVWRPYDGFEVRRGCEVLAALPGDARSWRGTLAGNGVHSLTLHGRFGAETRAAPRCTAVIGPGEVLRQAELDGWRPIDLASDGRALFVSDNAAKQVLRFDLDGDFSSPEAFEVSGFFTNGGADHIGGIAIDAAAQQLFLYNLSEHSVGAFSTADLSFDSSVDARVPHRDEASWRRPSIVGMAFRPDGDARRGSLLLVDAAHDAIYELDRSGGLIREFPHPYRVIEPPIEGSTLGPISSGIALVAGQAGQCFLSGGRLREAGERAIFRVDLAGGQTIAASSIPTAGMRGSRFSLEHALHRGASRLFAVSSERVLYEIRPEEPPLAAPSFLDCAARAGGGEVELRFRADGVYEGIEVARDCEPLAVLAGDETRFVDAPPSPGVHEYELRALAGGRRSEAARCRVRTGIGAIVGRHFAWPVIAPRHLTRDPRDGSFFVTGRLRRTDADALDPEAVHRFDAGFRYRESLPPPMDGTFPIDALALRYTPEGERRLYFIVHQNDEFQLLAKTPEGEFLEQHPLLPPRPDPPFPSAPTALAWDEGTDTFYYLERHSGTFVEADVAGRTLRTFAHPAPAPNHFFSSVGAWVSSGQRTLWAPAITLPSDIHENRLSRLVEIGLDGALTGREVPLPPESGFGGLAGIGGEELVIVGLGQFQEFVRLQSYGGDPNPGGEFVRGDVDGSGKIELTDAVRSLGFLFRGGATPPCFDAADVNDDGLVNISDPIAALQYLFLGASAPPAPFPERGPDPSPDGLSCGGAAG
jgi:sugar lactone lactonase YvrE